MTRYATWLQVYRHVHYAYPFGLRQRVRRAVWAALRLTIGRLA